MNNLPRGELNVSIFEPTYGKNTLEPFLKAVFTHKGCAYRGNLTVKTVKDKSNH